MSVEMQAFGEEQDMGTCKLTKGNASSRLQMGVNYRI